MKRNLLNIEKLTIEFKSEKSSKNTKNTNKVVDEVTFSISSGEILGIVGESGSGKTMTALSIAGLLPRSANINGSIKLYEKELTTMNENELRAINGNEISMIFQEPMTSLNPVLKVGYQVEEVLKIHRTHNKSDRKELVIKTLEDVGLTNPEEIYNKYPHQLSGGMRQRVMIAMAIICEPTLIIADEPTTALDVTLQTQILDLLKRINQEKNIAIILISHNLRIIKNICENVLIMSNGVIVESGNVNKIFNNPLHTYTKSLMNTTFQKNKLNTNNSLNNEKNINILEIKNLNISYPDTKKRLLTSTPKIQVVKDINLSLKSGEILGIVGESGSGKTTLAKAIVNLIKDIEGEITIHAPHPQMVFQDPYSSLNPAKTINQILKEPLKINGIYTSIQINNKVSTILQQVGLKEEQGNRYPNQLSGGQRQRVSIATALIQNNKIIILDEPVSALDTTVGTQILKLLMDLREQFSLSYIFISHDLHIIRQICDKVAVMYNGYIIEQGTTEEIYNSPKNEYTKKLLKNDLYVY